MQFGRHALKCAAGMLAGPSAMALQTQERGAMMSYIWMALVGLVVGLIARALLPGDQKLGLILTAALGIAGSFIAGFAGQALGWYQAGQNAGFIGSVLGALGLLFVVSKIKGSESTTTGT
jgi:uncharacterized membrane protein YeaQ/YmgE (transglycosylase-associated protein family)